MYKKRYYAIHSTKKIYFNIFTTLWNSKRGYFEVILEL